MDKIFPGIWKVTLGQPEDITPVKVRHTEPAVEAIGKLPPVAQCPIPEVSLWGRQTKRGFSVRIGLQDDEQIYGLGLQLLSFNQRQSKKTLRVNSDPTANLGDTHAPVPFYLSTAGYGVLVDTARYAAFYFGVSVPRRSLAEVTDERQPGYSPRTLEENIAWVTRDRNGPVIIDIPTAEGIDIYIFGGPEMRTALQRYNLFSGGGCLPPRWGLGVWYRASTGADQQQVLSLSETLRNDQMPCDVIGLEPGWQSHAYSCSFTWNKAFPEPRRLVSQLVGQHYHVNLWSHVFTHPSSPVYEALSPYSGDYEVWGGLVPDLLMPEARQIMAEYFTREHVDLGVSGYKLDECDNSDFNTNPWSFPESSQFPSGADGEVMHSLLGIQLQDTIEGIFRQSNLRTYGGVRSSHALAAPYPFVLYSDLYKHKDFIRGLVNCGFSGLLWTPEVRDAASEEDLIRRLQAVMLSPQALINAWYIKNPPWKQWRTVQNNADQFVENLHELEAACRKILELRMQLIPYLYTAFYHYHQEGIPPFRALVLDYPTDPNVWQINDQWMVGDRLLAAPVTAGEQGREVYLPEGPWYDFWNGHRIEGGQKLSITVPLDTIPLFVRGDSVLPLAQPTLHIEDPASYNLVVRIFGAGNQPFTLYEDDGLTFGYRDGQFNTLTITWDNQRQSGNRERTGDFAYPGYKIERWERL